MKKIVVFFLCLMLYSCGDSEPIKYEDAIKDLTLHRCEEVGVSTRIRSKSLARVKWKDPIKGYWWNIDKLCKYPDPVWGCANPMTGDIFYTDKENLDHELCHTLGYPNHTKDYEREGQRIEDFKDIPKYPMNDSRCNSECKRKHFVRKERRHKRYFDEKEAREKEQENDN